MTLTQLQQNLAQLAPRDRLALLGLAAFLVIFGLGASLYKMHQLAMQAQVQATEQRELLLWMRSQANNIKPTQNQPPPLTDIIQMTAQNQGLTVSQLPVGNQIQVQVMHQSFAVLGQWLTRLAEQGVAIDQLEVNQVPSGDIQLKALLK